MSEDWKRWRPAIWLAMVGIALALAINPPYIGVIFIGAGIGAAIRIRQRDRRLARSSISHRKRDR
jgi:4-amino-4-deoxy-L-arabinose transferase-like glycosyltransferase